MISGVLVIESHDFPVVGNCGTLLQVTTRAIVLGCPSDQNNTGRITIYSRPINTNNPPVLIADIEGPYKDAMFGQSFEAIETQQTFGT